MTSCEVVVQSIFRCTRARSKPKSTHGQQSLLAGHQLVALQAWNATLQPLHREHDISLQLTISTRTSLQLYGYIMRHAFGDCGKTTDLKGIDYLILMHLDSVPHTKIAKPAYNLMNALQL